MVPTGAKVGIDATISEGVPHERYERIAYAYADHAKIDDYLNGKADNSSDGNRNDEKTVAELAGSIYKLIDTEPKYYQEIADHFGDYNFQIVARALGKLHAEEKLWQDARGRACVRGSRFSARPPSK
jgi:2,5-furandicarboxylate decarboxylase 1